MTRKSFAQAAADRREMILWRKMLVPDGYCHYCGWEVPKLAHWCCGSCAKDFDKEKTELPT